MVERDGDRQAEVAKAQRLLREALVILDAHAPGIAAIHVCWAIDLLAKKS